MVTLTIDRSLFATEPELRACAFAAASLDRASARLSARDLDERWSTAARRLGEMGITSDTVTRLPGEIAAVARRVLAEGGAVTPVPLMSLALAAATTHLVSIGGYDVDALPVKTITLRRLRPGGDWFLPLEAVPADVDTDPDDLVFACETLVLELLSHALVSRQACLRAGSRRAVFVSHARGEREAEEAAAAIEDLRGQLAALGCEVGDAMFVDSTAPDVTLRIGRGRRHREHTDDT
ncbi:MAG TPA: hypothetical protein VH417_17595 [Vicinamibacterales bacterium]